ncbi:MAG: aconitase X catalytic domain-containing protein [Desulfurococcaceae archaeon]
MYLTEEQERILQGKYGWAAAKALELIVKVGDAVGAQELVEIKHAHVSGISYSNIGKYGLEFIRDFYGKGGRAKVYTTINPGCLDYSGLSRIVENRYVEEQRKIDEALIGMGFKPVLTCIPYYYRPPTAGEHLAWGESSAVIYANSFFGAYTNREGGPVALAASIVGYTYKAGLHLDENRVARVKVEVPVKLLHLPAGALGLWIGEFVNEVPYVVGLKNIDTSELKALLASMASTGSHALAVLEGITPRNTYRLELEDRVTVEEDLLENYLGDDLSGDDKVLGYIGCPHVHPVELLVVIKLLGKYGRPKRGKLLVTVPREYVSKFRGIIYELKARGVDVAAGTCPVVSRLRERFDAVVTNSGKAAFYIKKVYGVKVRLAKLEGVVKYVCGSKG